MNFTITHNALMDRVEVLHHGDLTLRILSQSVPAVKQLCSELNCWNILSDVRQTIYRLLDTEEFSVAQQLAEIFPQGTHFIILHLDSQIPIDRSRLLEQTVLLHGLQLNFSSDEDEIGFLFQTPAYQQPVDVDAVVDDDPEQAPADNLWLRQKHK